MQPSSYLFGIPYRHLSSLQVPYHIQRQPRYYPPCSLKSLLTPYQPVVVRVACMWHLTTPFRIHSWMVALPALLYCLSFHWQCSTVLYVSLFFLASFFQTLSKVYKLFSNGKHDAEGSSQSLMVC